MKTTDWRWNGRGRRHGYWHISRRAFTFKTAESPRWFVMLFGRISVSWWPNDKPRLSVRIGK